MGGQALWACVKERGLSDVIEIACEAVPGVRTQMRRGTEERKPVQVVVRDNNIDQALRALKKKMQREGVFREMKLRNHYEKPSEKRARNRVQREGNS